MVPEQRDVLDEIISKIRAGRMKRRTFLERAIAIGLSSSAAISLLDACGGSTPISGSKTINLVWQSEYDTTGAYRQIVDNFNKISKDIYVTLQSVSNNTDDVTDIERNTLNGKSSAIDIMSIDIVYPAEFASNNWIVPITEKQWPSSEREKYLQGPIKGCTFDEKLWAAPFRTDAGLIYYRTDIVSTPPNSWEELTSIAIEKQTQTKYGYVWQGSLYEGLVCNFDEVLHGYGGSILDSKDSTKVTVNSANALQALQEMVSWINTITPFNVVSYYREDQARIDFQNGDALFMRNWPYAYANANTAAESKVVGKFAIHPMLYGGENTVGHSSIGGWQLAINAFSNSDKQAAAWEFIKYMLSPEAQKIGATVATWAVTLKSVYDDPEVVAKAPLFKQLKPIVETSLPRPVTPKYKAVSSAIQNYVHQAFTKTLSPGDALDELASALKSIVTK